MKNNYLKILLSSIIGILSVFICETLVILILNLVPMNNYFTPSLIKIMLIYLCAGFILSLIITLFQRKTESDLYVHNVIFIFILFSAGFYTVKFARKLVSWKPDYAVFILLSLVLIFLIYKFLKNIISNLLSKQIIKKWYTLTIIFTAAVIVLSGFVFSPKITNIGITKNKVKMDKNVILISIDTLRADHVSCYGYSRKTTPFLDKLAAEGLRYDFVVTAMPFTSPGHATILTSKYPEEHGVLKNGWRLFDDQLTLSEIMQYLGYNTAGFVSVAHLSSFYGFSQGFKHFSNPGKLGWLFLYVNHQFIEYIYDYFDSSEDRENIERIAENTLSDVREFAGNIKETPYFMFIHLFDPHRPYEPPEKYKNYFKDGKTAKTKEITELFNNYDGEIKYVDDQLKLLFDFLDNKKLLNNTLVVITSDHGDAFGEHNTFKHGPTLFHEEVNIPLIIWSDKKIVKQNWLPETGYIVENLDVAPTIVKYISDTGVPVFRGASLYRPENKLPFKEAFLRTRDDSLLNRMLGKGKKVAPEFAGLTYYRRAVIRDGYKFIKTYVDRRYGLPEYALYDYKNDYLEKKNLASEDINRVKLDETIIEDMFKKFKNKKEQGMDERTKKTLESLGY